MAPARDPSRLGQFTLGYSRLGVYHAGYWESHFAGLVRAVTWEIANWNVARDTVTGLRDPSYSLTRTIYAVFEERGGDLLRVPSGFVQRGDAVLSCFDNVREGDRILLPESGRLFGVEYVYPVYEPYPDKDSQSFCYRVCDLKLLTLLSMAGPAGGETRDWEDWLYPSTWCEYSLCAQAIDEESASATCTMSLTELAIEAVPACAVACAYSLSVAPT